MDLQSKQLLGGLIFAAALLLMVFSGSILFDSLYADRVALPTTGLSASVVAR